MPKRTISILALSLGCLGAASASARTFDDAQARQLGLKLESFTCPIGGKTFRQAVTYSEFPLFTWPDGSHMGDEWIEMQLPECPDNHLLILPDYAVEPSDSGRPTYRVYTREELSRLPALMADPEFAALAGATRQVRGYWLATRLGRPVLDRMAMLSEAAWGASSEAQRRQALELFVRDMPALIDAYFDEPQARAGARIRVVNALRELGRFDEALALLSEIEKQGFAFETPVGPDAMFSEGPYLPKLRAVIEAGNADRNPIALLESGVANRICGDPAGWSGVTGPHTATDCTAYQAARSRELKEQGIESGEDEARPVDENHVIDLVTEEPAEANSPAATNDRER
jgi:hypothetical protein